MRQYAVQSTIFDESMRYAILVDVIHLAPGGLEIQRSGSARMRLPKSGMKSAAGGLKKKLARRLRMSQNKPLRQPRKGLSRQL